MKGSLAIKVLSIPSFRFFLSTRLFLTLALQMQAVIVGWEVYKITDDPLSLGLIGLAEAIPAISVALYAGHIADIHNRKTILQVSLLIMLACSAGLYLTFTDNLIIFSKTFQVYLMIFLSGFARGFYAPASFSVISKLVPRELLTQASTLNSTVWQFAAVAGPAMAGFFYAYSGIGASGLLIIALTCIALLSASLIHLDHKRTNEVIDPVMVRLKEGISFVFTNKVVLSALSLDLFSVLFGGATALLPVFADEILNTGPEGLGLLRAAPSFGAVLTMTYLSLRKNIPSPGLNLLRVVAAFGLCMLLFGLSTSFYFSLVLLFLSGVFDSVSVVIRSNILQLQTPDSMRGRVSAVNSIFIGSSNEIGAFESGVAARLLGTARSVVFGGCMTLLVVGITARKAKSLRTLKLD